MAAAETARLIASLELKDRLSPGIKSATGSLGKLESRAYKVGRNIGTGIANAGKIAAVGIAAVASQVALGLDSLVRLEQQEAQTGAVLKSTGGAAHINAQEVTRLAEKYEGLNATIGDEFIRAGENMLLTFTNIRGKAFEPALASVLNLNTAMGKGPEGLTKTAILVGKALNDPTKGLTALTRVGVSFSKEQIKRIKALQKEGKIYEAQKIVLKELNKEFGGSFIAQGGTTAGKVAKFKDAIEDLQRSLATALLPTVSHVADALGDFLADPAVVRGAEDLGREIGNLFSRDNLEKAGRAISDVFSAVKGALPEVKSALQTVGGVVKGAVDAFKSLPPEIQKIAIAGLAVEKLTGGLVSTLAGGLISSVLKQLVSGVVNVQGASVIVTGPLAGGGGGGPDVPGVVPIVKPSLLTRVLQVAQRALILGQIAGSIGPERLPTGGTTDDQIFDLKRSIENAARLNADDISANGKETNKQLIERLTTKLTALQSGVVTTVGRLDSAMHATGAATKQAVGAAGIAQTIAIRNAAIRTAEATHGVQRSVDRKDLSVTVNARTQINVSGREWLEQATQTNIRQGAS